MDDISTKVRYCYGLNYVEKVFKVVSDDKIDHKLFQGVSVNEIVDACRFVGYKTEPILVTQSEQNCIYEKIMIAGDFETGMMIDRNDVRAIGMLCVRDLRHANPK